MLAQRIRGDSIAYGGSMLLVRILAFCALAAFARMLSPQQLGALNILTMAGLAAGSVASVEIAQAILRYCAGPRDGARATFYASGFWFALASCVLTAILLGVFSRSVSLLLFGDEQWADEVALYSWCVACNSIFLLLQSLCRAELRRRAFTVATVTFALGSLSLSLLFAQVSSRPLMGLIAGQALGALAGAVVALGFLGVPRISQFSGTALRQLLRFSAPLVIGMLGVLAATYANRFVLARWGTLGDVAAFTVASQIANFAALTLVGIQSALGPLILAHHEDKDTPRQVSALFGRFWIVTMTVCLLLGIVAEPLVALIFPPSYRGSAEWIFPLSVATILSQVYVFWPGFSVAKWTMGQMMVTVGAGIAGVVINVLAVAQWGVAGAVGGAVVGSMIFLLSWITFSNLCYRVPVSLLKMAFISGCAYAAYAAVALHGTLQEITIVTALKAAAVATLFVFVASATMTNGWRVTRLRYIRRGT